MGGLLHIFTAALFSLAATRVASRAVFAHLMFGETQDYSVDDHVRDQALAAEVGLTALAINTGHDSYDQLHLQNVFTAANQTGIKLFFSFDLLHYNVDNASNWIIYDYLIPYANLDAYYRIDGCAVVSTFGGNQEGQYLNGLSTFEEANLAWNNIFDTVKTLTPSIDVYFAPFWLTMPENTPTSTLQLDAVGNWFGFGTTGAVGNLSVDADISWKNQTSSIGADYWAGVSAQFSVHQTADRNYVNNGGDFLLPSHYADLINLDDSAPDYVELITFSDWGESTYLGPIHNTSSPPVGDVDTSVYVTNHDHQPFLIMSAFFTASFVNGVQPTISSEVVFWWHRGQTTQAVATNDPLGRPDGTSVLTDTIYVVVFLPEDTEATQVVVTTGGEPTDAQAVLPGINKLMTTFVVGETGVSLQDADGNELLGGSGQTISDDFEIYDYNFYAFSIPANVMPADFLLGTNFSTSASTSKTTTTTTSASTTSSTTESDATASAAADTAATGTASKMTTSVRATSTTSSSAASSSSTSSSGSSSSNEASSTTSRTWWVGCSVAAVLLLIAVVYWRRSLTSRDGSQYEEPSSDSETSSSSALDNEKDGDTSSASSASSTSSSSSPPRHSSVHRSRWRGKR